MDWSLFFKLLMVVLGMLAAIVLLVITSPTTTTKVTVTVPACPAPAPAQFYPTPTGNPPYAQLLTGTAR